MKKDTALVLRTCSEDGTSHNGFKWPLKVGAVVKCSDWKPTKECGNGLHGLLWGEGNGSLLSWDNSAKWMVVSVKLSDVVMLGGKCKFPECKILFVGDRKGATDYLIPLVQNGKKVVGAFVTAGDRGTATAGYSGTATAGDRGTATAGNRGTATAGDRGTATAGDWGTATAGDSGTATAGYSGTATAGDSGTATAGYSGTATAGNRGTATAGNRGTATAGDWGTATAGNRGTATAGDWGTATAGDWGTATAGDRGTATAGDRGEIRIRWYDEKHDRDRTAIAYVGEDGIKPYVKYRLNDKHEFEEVK